MSDTDEKVEYEVDPLQLWINFVDGTHLDVENVESYVSGNGLLSIAFTTGESFHINMRYVVSFKAEGTPDE